MLVTIHLNNLRFFAYHGLYEEEKQLGNEFELNIVISFISKKEIIEHMSDTINYATIYELAKKEMLQPRELLETFLSQLAEKIKEKFPETTALKMTLYKLQMPLNNFKGKIGVEIEKNYIV